MMRALGLLLFIAASAASADTESEGVIDELEVRLSEIEVIDVTTEKQPVDTGDELDADIEDILENLEALETEESSEQGDD